MGAGTELEYVVLLKSTPLTVSKYMSTVTRGRVTVSTTTTPGYCRRVACTSIWQSLVQEIEAELLELALGAKVCTIVVGTSSVVVIIIDEIAVDTIVEAGIWLVMICVDPG